MISFSMIAVKASVPGHCLFGLKITGYLEVDTKKGLRTKLKVEKALCKGRVCGEAVDKITEGHSQLWEAVLFNRRFGVC